MSIHRARVVWRKIEDHKPPEAIKLMVCGPSFVTSGQRYYILLAYYDEEFRPSQGGPIRWQTIGNNAVTDEYAQPTHWAYPPHFPED